MFRVQYRMTWHRHLASFCHEFVETLATSKLRANSKMLQDKKFQVADLAMRDLRLLGCTKIACMLALGSALPL